MVRFIAIFSISVFVFIASCGRKTVTYSSEPVGTFFVESPSEGLVTLRSDGFGSNLRKAETDAVTKGFEAILFRGIPQYTGLNRPMIASESKFKSNNPGWFEDFIESGTYERFIHKDFGTQELSIQTGKRVNREFTINYKNLRIYLEEEGLIRRFGY
jgi:hypothetical protein